jgi:hypothetical protein
MALGDRLGREEATSHMSTHFSRAELSVKFIGGSGTRGPNQHAGISDPSRKPVDPG